MFNIRYSIVTRILQLPCDRHLGCTCDMTNRLVGNLERNYSNLCHHKQSAEEPGCPQKVIAHFHKEYLIFIQETLHSPNHNIN